MKVLVTGATGFVGTRLVNELFKAGHEVNLLSRNAAQAKAKFSIPVNAFSWNTAELPPKEAFAGVEAVVNLAGEGIANKRWSESQKKKIYDSRITGTTNLLKGLHNAGVKPKVIVSATAIGFYGDRGNEILKEDAKKGSGFLADVCADWEKAASENATGIRLVNLRIGVVLGSNGGMLQKLLPLFKLALGGPVGNGKQWMSWVHVDDLVSLMLYSIANESVSGILNAVAPKPVTNGDFTKAMGQTLSRPAVLPAPAFGIKLAMGELSALVLDSQKVSSEKAEHLGFKFEYPTIDKALNEIVKKKVN